jgi:hypothetical protein
MRIKSFVVYETPGGASGGGGAPVAPAAPTPPTPTPQPGAPGQGQGQGDGFRQTYFPNVPDDQWSLMEPHLQNINKHVTQTEQRFAPLARYTPQAVQGIAQFVQGLEQDPRGQWIQLATLLQQRGDIDPDLDLEYLALLAEGKDPDATPASNGAGPQLGGLPPEVQQLIQGLQQQVQELSKNFTQTQQTQQQRVEDAALNRNLDYMKAELKKGGMPESVLEGDEARQRLLASFVAHRGNAQAAVQAELNHRNALLGTLTNAPPKPGEKQLDLPQGAPKPASRGSSGARQRRGMFADVSTAAEQSLRAMDAANS